jgi:hypothetical protein
MVAMPKVMIRGWALEAGTQVRLVVPTARRERANPMRTEYAARQQNKAQDANRRRIEWQRTWYAIGGH